MGVLFVFAFFAVPETGGRPVLYAQQRVFMLNQSVPAYEYDYAWESFTDGDFFEALKRFQKGRRSAVNIGGLPWVDSICYQAMIGECQFYMGNYPEALAAYESAIDLWLAYEDWPSMIRVAGALDQQARGQTPWGTSLRNNPLAVLPKTFHLNVVTQDFEIQTEEGAGRVHQEELVPVRVPEVFRCLSLAIRHRAEILGPLSKFDRKNDELLESLSARPGVANHWSSTWVDLVYGLSLSAAGKDDEAFSVLEAASVMLGRLDHTLTGVALCEMGKIKLRSGDAKAAGILFYEASIAAAFFGDPVILEESFRGIATAQRLLDKTKPCELLQVALKYSYALLNNRRKDVCANPFVLVSLLEEVADDRLNFADLVGAKERLDLAQELMRNRALKEGRFGGRWNYLKAWAFYQAGRPADLAEGDKHLQIAMGFMQKCSPWVAQLKYLATLQTSGRISTAGSITMRKALELYDYLLREPTSRDWLIQPMDSLAVLITPMQTPSGTDVYELWFQTAVELDYKDRAFEISEQVRRRRFFATDPFGSRLPSLRMLFGAPTSELPRKNILDRQELLLAFPDFAKLSEESTRLKSHLRALPAVPTSESQAKERLGLFTDLENISTRQEMMLRSIALSRLPSPSIFPPRLSLNEIQAELPQGTSMLVFFSAVGQLHGFLIDAGHFEMWKVSSKIEDLRIPFATFLKTLGNGGVDKEVAAKDLRETTEMNSKEAKKNDWKTQGNQLLQKLLQGTRQAEFTELVVVPDYFLWYIPFEALSVEDVDGKLRPLIAANNSSLSIRYAPTAALGIPSRQGRAHGAETLVVAGKLFPKDPPEKSHEKLEEFAKEINGIEILPSGSLPVSPSLFMVQLKQLVVFNDISAGRGGPLDWNPFGNEKRRSADISDWLQLPWGGPSLIVLPGYHTAAENAMRSGGNGSELFYPLLTMQANGARTVLISRWRPGGTSSYDFVEAFLKNYAQFPAAESWRKAVLSAAGKSITFDEEPRVKADKDEKPMRANHPFFWGAFLLADRGEILVQEEAEEPLPSLEELKKEFSGPTVQGETVSEPTREPGAEPEPDSGKRRRSTPKKR